MVAEVVDGLSNVEPSNDIYRIGQPVEKRKRKGETAKRLAATTVRKDT